MRLPLTGLFALTSLLFFLNLPLQAKPQSEPRSALAMSSTQALAATAATLPCQSPTAINPAHGKPAAKTDAKLDLKTNPKANPKADTKADTKAGVKLETNADEYNQEPLATQPPVNKKTKNNASKKAPALETAQAEYVPEFPPSPDKVAKNLPKPGFDKSGIDKPTLAKPTLDKTGKKPSGQAAKGVPPDCLLAEPLPPPKPATLNFECVKTVGDVAPAGAVAGAGVAGNLPNPGSTTPVAAGKNANKKTATAAQGVQGLVAANQPVVNSCPVEAWEILKNAGIDASSVAFMAQLVNPKTIPLFAHNAEKPMILASTSKVITAVAALENLGAGFRWPTRAYALGKIENGVLRGNLMLVGGGDPTLSGNDLRNWFKEMQSKGLQRIDGNIIIDRMGFYFTERDNSTTPKEDEDNPHHRWPDVFAINNGFIHGHLSLQQNQLQIKFDPPLDGVKVVNQLKNTGKCGEPTLEQLDTPMQETIGVRGEWSEKCGKHEFEMVTDSEHALTPEIVAGIWKETGGSLSGVAHRRITLKPKNKPTPYRWTLPRKPWSVHSSAALPAVIKEMNKWSNNSYARQMMLSLSKGFPNQTANMAGAKARVHAWLNQKGWGKGDFSIDTGSGLSRLEKAKSRAFVDLLRRTWASKNYALVLNSLPIAGVDGTLSRRMKDTSAQNNAYLKTGTINGVRTLAGYVKAKSGRVYAVATLINHGNAHAGKPAMDSFIVWLVENG